MNINNKMIPTNVNNTILHSHDDSLPPNFQVCTHGHVCPECHSSLIVKKSPAVANENDTNKDTNNNSSTSSSNPNGCCCCCWWGLGWRGCCCWWRRVRRIQQSTTTTTSNSNMPSAAEASGWIRSSAIASYYWTVHVTTITGAHRINV